MDIKPKKGRKEKEKEVKENPNTTDMKLKRKKKSHRRRRRKWNTKRICIIEEVKVKESGNKRIRESEEDPDITEIEEALPDIDEDNDGMSKLLEQIDKELGLPKVLSETKEKSDYITISAKGPDKKWSNGPIKKTKKWFFSSGIIQ